MALASHTRNISDACRNGGNLSTRGRQSRRWHTTLALTPQVIINASIHTEGTNATGLVGKAAVIGC
jgi:hypothetical protein